MMRFQIALLFPPLLKTCYKKMLCNLEWLHYQFPQCKLDRMVSAFLCNISIISRRRGGSIFFRITLIEQSNRFLRKPPKPDTNNTLSTARQQGPKGTRCPPATRHYFPNRTRLDSFLKIIGYGETQNIGYNLIYPEIPDNTRKYPTYLEIPNRILFYLNPSASPHFSCQSIQMYNWFMSFIQSDRRNNARASGQITSNFLVHKQVRGCMWSDNL